MKFGNSSKNEEILKQNLDLLKRNLSRIIENEKLLSEDSTKQ